MEWARWGFCLRAGDLFSFEFNVSRRERYIGLAVLRRLEIHVYRNRVFSNVYLLMFIHIYATSSEKL